MRFLLFLFLFTGVVFAQNLSAQGAEKWTLEKCIKYALENNVQVRQAALGAKVSSADRLQSKLNLLPTIDFNASYSENFGNGFNPQTFSFAEGNSQSLQMQLQGTVPIFTGLQQIYNIQRAKYDFLASKYDYENAQNNVALNVASAYLQILLNKEIEKVSEKQRLLTVSQKEIVVNRIKAGALPETAIYDLEATLGRDEVNIVNAKNAINLSVLALAQLLQLKDVNSFEVDVPEVKADNLAGIENVTSQGIFDYAMNNQPGVRGSEARVMSAEASQKISYGTLSPTIAAFGNLSSGYFSQDKKLLGYNSDTIVGSGNTPGGPVTFQIPIADRPAYGTYTFQEELHNNFRKVIGLQLDVPLFSKCQKILNIQKSKLQLQIRQLQLEGTKNQLRSDIETAYANAKAAAESYLANEKSVTASQKAYQATQTRYSAGLASNFDIEQAKQNVVAAESQQIQSKYTYVFRMKILDFYQGKPITLN